jgi:hypothetical protein
MLLRVINRSNHAAFLFFLKQQEPATYLVVTHGTFIKVVVSLMVYGEKLTSHQYLHMLGQLGTIENTALSIHSHTEKNWVLRVWNDQQVEVNHFKKGL